MTRNALLTALLSNQKSFSRTDEAKRPRYPRSTTTGVNLLRQCIYQSTRSSVSSNSVEFYSYTSTYTRFPLLLVANCFSSRGERDSPIRCLSLHLAALHACTAILRLPCRPWLWILAVCLCQTMDWFDGEGAEL